VEDPWPNEPRTAQEDRELAPLAAICSAPMSSAYQTRFAAVERDAIEPLVGPYAAMAIRPSPGLLLSERVAVVAHLLLWGEPLSGARSGDWGDMDVSRRIWRACLGAQPDTLLDLDRTVSLLRDARARVEASCRALAEEAGGLGTVDGVLPDGTRYPAVIGDGRAVSLVIVRSAHPDALELGFCMAPVVVQIETRGPCDRSCGSYGGCGDGRLDCALCHLCDEGDHCSRAPKLVTIAGWAGPDGRTRYADLAKLRGELDRREVQFDASRSGPWSIDDAGVHTPAGGTQLSEEAIVREGMACLR
jgi:hypothetical protein